MTAGKAIRTALFLLLANMNFVGIAAAEDARASGGSTLVSAGAVTASTPAGGETVSKDAIFDLLKMIPTGNSGGLIEQPPAGNPAVAPLTAPSITISPEVLLPPTDIWERIRRGFQMPDLDTKLTAERTRWYAAQPEYITRMATRSGRFMFHILEELDKRGMPTELALLPFVESAFQPAAVSTAKAAGLWQFIPSTGKDYDLQQNMWKDERRDVIESTRAALDYLQRLHDMFGDWQLALAAYNWGEGSVARAIEKNERAGRPTDYLSLKMPVETQNYVPKLQAIKNIVAEPEKFGITLPPIINEPYFVQIQKSRDMDVKTAAHLANLKVEEFLALNPSFNGPVIIGASNQIILLPADKVDSFQANLAAWEATDQPLSSWTTYTMHTGETLAGVAKRVGISEAQLREANRIPLRYRTAAGSTLLIPRDENMEADISADFLDTKLALVPEQAAVRRVTYRVKRGDTLQSVARRWKVSPDELVIWNHLRNNALFSGQRLNLMVPNNGPTRVVRRSSSSARRSVASTSKKSSPRAASAKVLSSVKLKAQPITRVSVKR